MSSSEEETQSQDQAVTDYGEDSQDFHSGEDSESQPQDEPLADLRLVFTCEVPGIESMGFKTLSEDPDIVEFQLPRCVGSSYSPTCDMFAQVMANFNNDKPGAREQLKGVVINCLAVGEKNETVRDWVLALAETFKRFDCDTHVVYFARPPSVLAAEVKKTSLCKYVDQSWQGHLYVFTNTADMELRPYCSKKAGAGCQYYSKHKSHTKKPSPTPSKL